MLDFSKQKKAGYKTFLIWGSNFKNKGAQAMLFTSVSELRTRFNNCRILFNTNEIIPEGYCFETVHYGLEQLVSLQRNPFLSYIRYIKRLLLHRNLEILDYYKLRRDFKKIDAILDISGYALSSQWEEEVNKHYLRMINVAKKYHVPVFLMPQSFGPFEYGDKQKEMDRLIVSELSYPIAIYARENIGYFYLTGKYNLKNVRRSVDLVLQNKSINESFIFSKRKPFKITSISTQKNVAIIPNMRNLDHGKVQKSTIIRIYTMMINELRGNGFSIYLIRHSDEDIDACKDIYNSLNDKDGVYLFLQEYDCIEFNKLIINFSFIIASRYHSIVHAYKNAVPAIVLGWAEKYHELLRIFDQTKYLFDVRNINNRIEIEIINALKEMEIRYKNESKYIGEITIKYQDENCFDIIKEYFYGDIKKVGVSWKKNR